MTIAYFHHSFLRRTANGPKAHAAAAYISGTRLDHTNETADYTRKSGVLVSAIWSPLGAPEWTRDRGEYWRRVEERENQSTRHATALLAHKFVAALPHELPLQILERLVKDFVRENFTRHGYVVDWAIHAPGRHGDERNYHLHIMVALRRIEKDGTFSSHKDRFPKNSSALSEFIRGKQTAYFKLMNRYLQRYGIDSEVLREQGRWVVAAPKPANTLPSKIREAWFEAVSGSEFLKEAIADNRNKSLDIKNTDVHHKLDAKLVLFHGGQSLPWPEAAIKDWVQWGKTDPAKFFGKWPTLALQSFDKDSIVRK